MPGYYLHLAACNPENFKNRAFQLGIEVPDILKKYYQKYGIEETEKRYNILKATVLEGDMPDFAKLKNRIIQKERIGNNDGMHYGISSCPDIRYFWDSLSNIEKQMPFWKGYFWHLMTDLVMYSVLDIDTKFNVALISLKGISKEKAIIAETIKLHHEWDITNSIVKRTYPEVQLTSEILELDIVHFSEDGELYYVDWNSLKLTIDTLRSYDVLGNNPEDIIHKILEHFS